LERNDLKHNIRISKEVLPELPSDYEETELGDKRGASKQYRNLNVHVREYDDSYTIHIDRADPRRDPLGHLLKDAPETVAAFATSLYFAKRSLDRAGSKQKDVGENQSVLRFSLLSFLSSFIAMSGLYRWLKELLL
jgi:hypothetical protein